MSRLLPFLGLASVKYEQSTHHWTAVAWDGKQLYEGYNRSFAELIANTYAERIYWEARWRDTRLEVAWSWMARRGHDDA